MGKGELVTSVVAVPGGTANVLTNDGDAMLALLRDENATLRALLALQAGLGDGAPPREVLQEVTQQARAVLGCARCYALLWDPARERFLPAASAGFDDATIATLKQVALDPATTPLLRHLGATGEVLDSEDAATRRLCSADFPLPGESGAVLLAPVRGQTRPLHAVLVFDFPHPLGAPSPLTPERRQLAGIVAGQLTLLLDHANLYEEFRQRASRLEALTELGLGLAARASDDPATIFAQLYPRVATVVDGAGLFLALRDEAEPAMTIWGALDGRSRATAMKAPLGADLFSRVIAQGRAIEAGTRDALQAAGGLPTPLTGDAEVAAAVCLPLRVRRTTIGALAVVNHQPGAYTTEQLEFLGTVAAQTAIAARHGRLYALLRARGEVRRRLLDQTLHAQETERKHLVDELLDGTLQELASCVYQLDLCARLVERGDYARSRDELGQTRRQLTARIEALRELAAALRPASLDALGLAAVLHDELGAFGRRHGVRTVFHTTLQRRLPPAVETRAYRIAQELLANVARHAAATRVGIELTEQGDEVVLRVTDDGGGFDTRVLGAEQGGMGLHAVREQADLVGGVVQVRSQPGGGTRVAVSFPGAASAEHHER